jgi:iron complex transport system ATP-binding protein
MVMSLDVREVHFSYGGGPLVLRGVNLNVPAGEVACILGPNGCGKSTLLKCVARLLVPTHGAVQVGGQNVATLRREEIARLIGYIPQEHILSFPYSVRQVVLMGRAPYVAPFASPTARDIAISEEAMERVGIQHLRDKRYTEISGGERQLALIARVVAQQPRVLLLDEPTSHLDFRNQIQVLALIRMCARQGMCVVMSSHFPNHALGVASHIALMKDGTFVAQGPPDQVVTENNLRTIYDVDVRIYTVTDPTDGRLVRFCSPAQLL